MSLLTPSASRLSYRSERQKSACVAAPTELQRESHRNRVLLPHAKRECQHQVYDWQQNNLTQHSVGGSHPHLCWGQMHQLRLPRPDVKAAEAAAEGRLHDLAGIAPVPGLPTALAMHSPAGPSYPTRCQPEHAESQFCYRKTPDTTEPVVSRVQKGKPACDVRQVCQRASLEAFLWYS